MTLKKRLTLALGGAILLAAEWALVRFPLFGLHHMADWPWLLFIVGLIAAVIGGLLGAKWTVAGTLAGYPVGFACGMIFDLPGRIPGATIGWWVWTCVFLAGILLGTAASVVSALRRKHEHTKDG